MTIVAPLLAALTGIHPAIGTWATTLRDNGSTYTEIVDRLVGLVAAVEPDREGGYNVPSMHLFTPKDIGYLLVGEFEGNHMASWISGPVRPVAPIAGNWYFDETYIATPEFAFTIEYDDPNGEGGEGAADGKKIIDRAAIVAGLALMAKKSPSHWADLVGENADAITYDVAMQYIVLGDVVYG